MGLCHSFLVSSIEIRPGRLWKRRRLSASPKPRPFPLLLLLKMQRDWNSKATRLILYHISHHEAHFDVFFFRFKVTVVLK